MRQLSFPEKLNLVLSRAKTEIFGYLKFDSTIVRVGGGLLASLIASAALALGKRDLWFKLQSSVYNANLLPHQDRSVAARCAELLRPGAWLNDECVRRATQLAPVPATQAFFDDPERILGGRTIVVKSKRDAERGAILVDYNFSFPTLAHFYDLQRIAEHYYLVMLPSWTGMMDTNLLTFATLDEPVLCMAFEQKDFDFIASLQTNLRPVQVSANFFCDHRVFAPRQDLDKDIDVICVAAWGTYKRHERLLKALAEVKRRRGQLKAAFVGYPSDLTKGDIELQARYHGLEDNIEFHEHLSPEQVNDLYARSRVNVLWSRREGTPRTPIEGMLAGVPIILRQGFNFGSHYQYINERTGCFSTEKSLPADLIRYIDGNTEVDPRAWVLANMTPKIAMEQVSQGLQAFAAQNAEPWTQPLAEVCGFLNGQTYWDPADKLKFEGDYDFLRSCLRSHPNS